MARPLRIEYEGAWYHVMNRGRRKENIFLIESDYELFLKVLEKTSQMFGVEVHAYALMPNHYHLLICTPKGNLSRAMRHINGVYAQKFNKRHNVDGSVFRGRYKSILVEEETYLLELVRYIHRNAHEAGIEEKIGKYKWDSHKEYIKDKKSREWLIKEEVLNRFSKYKKDAIRELNAFVKKEMPKDLLKRLEGVNWPVVIGGKDFKEKIKVILRGEKINKEEISGYGKYEKDNEELEKNIGKILKEKKEVILKKRSKELSIERRAIIYLLRMNGKSLKETGEIMGGLKYVSVSREYKRAEDEIKKRSGCYKYYKEMVELLSINDKT